MRSFGEGLLTVAAPMRGQPGNSATVTATTEGVNGVDPSLVCVGMFRALPVLFVLVP